MSQKKSFLTLGEVVRPYGREFVCRLVEKVGDDDPKTRVDGHNAAVSGAQARLMLARRLERLFGGMVMLPHESRTIEVLPPPSWGDKEKQKHRLSGQGLLFPVK